MLPIPEQLYQQLQKRATALNTTPDLVLAQAIESYLSWVAFDEMLARMHMQNSHFSAKEVEADVNAELVEYRTEQRSLSFGEPKTNYPGTD